MPRMVISLGETAFQSLQKLAAFQRRGVKDQALVLIEEGLRRAATPQPTQDQLLAFDPPTKWSNQ